MNQEILSDILYEGDKDLLLEEVTNEFLYMLEAYINCLSGQSVENWMNAAECMYLTIESKWRNLSSEMRAHVKEILGVNWSGRKILAEIGYSVAMEERDTLSIEGYWDNEEYL